MSVSVIFKLVRHSIDGKDKRAEVRVDVFTTGRHAKSSPEIEMMAFLYS